MDTMDTMDTMNTIETMETIRWTIRWRHKMGNKMDTIRWRSRQLIRWIPQVYVHTPTGEPVYQPCLSHI